MLLIRISGACLLPRYWADLSLLSSCPFSLTKTFKKQAFVFQKVWFVSWLFSHKMVKRVITLLDFSNQQFITQNIQLTMMWNRNAADIHIKEAGNKAKNVTFLSKFLKNLFWEQKKLNSETIQGFQADKWTQCEDQQSVHQTRLPCSPCSGTLTLHVFIY